MVGVEFEMNCPNCNKKCIAEDEFKGNFCHRWVHCEECGLNANSDIFHMSECSDEELNKSILDNQGGDSK